MVGGGDKMSRRIISPRQLRHAAEPTPFIFAAVAGHWQHSGPVRSYWRETSSLPPDVPGNIGVHNVFAGNLVPFHGFREFFPVFGTRYRQTGQVTGCARLAPDPP